MKFLFFYSRLSLGGVETFIVRLSNWLIENGNQVCLVLIEASELDSQLHEDVQVFYFQTILRTFSPILHSSIRNALSPEIDAVCAFDPESFAMAAKTCHALSINKPYFYGVYHPRVLCPPWGGRWIGGVRRNLLRHYGSSSSLVFMNESCRRAQQACLGLSLAESKILPVAMPTTVPRLVRPVPRKIVSVGRLVPFKSYNLYMIDIVGQLVQKGVKNLTWHVYGDGMLRDEMQERINERGLQRNVFLHGSVPYSEFRTVVEDASVFVGMGTSLIEAGMIGVPGIPAIDSAGPMTYGYTHHLETYDVGEHLGRPPDRSVADLIEDLFQMPEEEYKRIERHTIAHCQRFDVQHVGSDFLQLVPSLGRTRRLSVYESVLIWSHFSLVTMVSLRDSVHQVAVSIVKKTLPRGLVPWARRLNRAWLSKRGWSEHARARTNEKNSRA